MGLNLAFSGWSSSSKSPFLREPSVFPADVGWERTREDLWGQPVPRLERPRNVGVLRFAEGRSDACMPDPESRNTQDVAVEDFLKTYLSSPATYPTMDLKEKHLPYVSADSFVPRRSPKLDYYAEKLEYLRNKSSDGKLERLKEKIREQRRRLDTSKERTWTPTGKPTLKRKVCKVAFAPPPHTHTFKGFGAGRKKADGSRVDTVVQTREPRNRNGKKADTPALATKGKTQTTVSQSPVSRKLSFESSSPEKRLRNADLYGASAWREGQKLVRKLLGPSPVLSKMPRVSPGDGEVSRIPARSNVFCHKAASRPVAAEPAGVTLDGVKTQRQQRISPGDRGARGSPRVREMPAPKGAMETHENRAGRSKTGSPLRPRSDMRCLGHTHSVKENLLQVKDRIRNYSVEEVREYMTRKNTERLKKERDARNSLQISARLKRKRLQDVFRKQKDAFPLRGDPAVCTKVTQRKPGEAKSLQGDIRTVPEWVQLKSSDLLKEEGVSRVNDMTHISKEPVHVERPSPLRLQDLDTISTAFRNDTTAITSNQFTGSSSSPPKTGPILSPCRDQQERLKAICSAAKELGERIRMEAGRLASKHHDGAVMSRNHSSTTKVSSVGSPKSRISSKLTLHRNIPHPATERRGNAVSGITPTSRTVNTTWMAVQDLAARQLAEKRPQVIQGYRDSHMSPTSSRRHTRKDHKGSPIHRSSSQSIQKMARITDAQRTERGSLKTPDLSGRKTYVEADEGKLISPPPASGSVCKCDVHHTEMDIVPRFKHLKYTEESSGRGVARTSQPSTETASNQRGDRFLCDLADPVGFPVPSGQIVSHDGWKRGKEEETPLLKHIIKIQDTEHEPVDDTWDRTEPATDSTSKWSEVSEFYGSAGMFSRFTLEMTRQCLREEELRSRHQAALLKLREEAVQEKARAELALLEHQRKCLEMNKEHGKLEELRRRQCEIQTNLLQEQAEIRHLHNIYKAAHQERKLLLKQQKEILQIQQSTVHIQQKLPVQLPGGPVEEITDAGLCNSAIFSEQTNMDTDNEFSDLQAEEAEPVEGGERITSGSVVGDAEPHSEVTQTQKKPVPEHQDTKINAEDSTTTESQSANQDGGAEGDPSPGVEEPMMGTARNNLRNLHQRIPVAEGTPRNHSQVSVVDEDSDVVGNSDGVKSVSQTRDRTNRDFTEVVTDTERSVEDAHPLQSCGQVISHTQSAGGSPTLELNSHQVFPTHGDPCFCKTPEDPQSGDVHPTPASDERSASLAEFLKVSAKLIQVSESSVSASDRTEEDQDTESGDSDVFDMEPGDLPCQVPRAEFEDLVPAGEPLAPVRTSLPPDDQVFIDTSAFGQSGDQKDAPSNITTTPRVKNGGGEGGQRTDSQHRTTNNCRNDTEMSYRSNSFPDNDGNLTSRPTSLTTSDDKGEQEAEVEGHLISTQTTKTVKVIKKADAEPKRVPLAYESFPTSSDFSESETNISGAEHLIEENSHDGVLITNLEKSTSARPEHIRNVDEICLPDATDRQKETNESPSLAEEKLISKKIETVPFPATSSKDLFQIKSFTHQNEENVTFITDEVLQPIQDTLSEILSPVDETLSYESADFYCAKKDSSYPSEELPSLPEDVESIKSNGVDSEDFPSPPEQVASSASDGLPSSLEGSIIEEIYKLDEGCLTEDVLQPLDDSDNQKASVSPPGDPGKGDVKIQKPFLTLSKADEDTNDPLFTFDIGDRVLVKLLKPGTLRFKGPTAFQEGYWAGVALDEPCGDHDGTYEGVTYFECPARCGVFVRPRQISHLLCDDKSASENVSDDDDEEHPFDEDSNPKGNESSEPKADVEGEESRDKSAFPIQNENKPRSCSVKATKCNRNIKVVDLCQPTDNFLRVDMSGRGVQTRNEDVTSEAFQKHMRYSETANPRLLSGDKIQRLVLGFSDDLMVRAIREAFGRGDIQRKCRRNPINDEYALRIRAEPSEERCFVSSALLLMISNEGKPDGLVVKKIIMDSLEKSNKSKRTKGREGETPSSYTCWSTLAGGVRKDGGNNGGLCKLGAAATINTADFFFEYLLGESAEATLFREDPMLQDGSTSPGF